MIGLEGVSKHYADRKILDDVSLFVKDGQRLAIIGKNGSGKSTLLRILAGLETPDDGEVRAKNIAFLAQDVDFDQKKSVKEILALSAKEIYDAKLELEELSLDLTNNSERYAQLTSFLDVSDGWDIEYKLEKIMQTFGLEVLQDKMPFELSGGEKRRLGLACLLIEWPQFLILDEPTNHLDVEMIEFLSQILQKVKGLIFISHDRRFIQSLATHIVELQDAKLHRFTGGYLSYLEQKKAILEAKQKEHQKDLRLFKSEQEWLCRGVKARLKRDEGRKKRLELLREKIKKNPSQIRRMQTELLREFIRPPQKQNRQKTLFRITDLSLHLGDKNLFSDFSTIIKQQDKIALVGKNGCGKSSFLKLLTGQNMPTKGEIEFGDINVAYFDQHLDMLCDDKNIIETFCPNGGDHINVGGRSVHVYGYLRSWGFASEFFDKKVGVLSGGERTRLALCLVMAKPCECLILDEPTNDLDIATINILEQHLINFKAAVIFASHDCYFVDKVANVLFSFENEQINILHVKYEELLEARMDEKILLSQPKEQGQKQTSRSKKLSYKQRQDYERLPQEIEALESQIKQLNAQMTLDLPSTDLQEFYELCEDKKLLLEEKIEAYLAIEEIVDEL